MDRENLNNQENAKRYFEKELVSNGITNFQVEILIKKTELNYPTERSVLGKPPQEAVRLQKIIIPKSDVVLNQIFALVQESGHFVESVIMTLLIRRS